MAKKLTAATIDKIEKRSELVKIIEDYELGIECKLARLQVIKEKIKERLDEINKKEENKSIETSKTVEQNNDINSSNEVQKESTVIEDKKTEKEEPKLENLKFEENHDIDTTDLILYRDSDLTKVNEFIVDTKLKLYPVVCLQNSKGEISGKLYIEEEEGKKYLVAPQKNIKFNQLENNSKCKLVFVDEEDRKKGYTLIINVKVKELEIFQGTLCIDFGTSNTSLGVYLPEIDDIRLVKFKDLLNEDIERETLPTVIYVENCADRNNVIYKFGYDAKKKIKDKDYNFKNTIFYEVKRWLLDIEKEEELIDGDQNEVVLKRKEILKAYFEYLLKEASNQFKYQFKKLHFSAPILLKDRYILALKRILDNYDVMDVNVSIDEGVAVVYDDIYNNIVKLNESENNEIINKNRKVMTIDVGGGTTDVISSTYSLVKKDNGAKLEIHTYPENSNSHFGGNNITYRIFQYLKIKIAKYLENGNLNIDIDDIIGMSKPDILAFIDSTEYKKNGTQKLEEIYYNFEQEYKKACEVLPTNFKTNDIFKTNKQRDLLKRNFYLLWEAAETIKIEFFKKTEIYLIDFISEDKDSKKIKIPNLDNLLFSIVKNGVLETIETVPQIGIGINEIQKLMYADIYKLIRDILGDKTNIISEYIKVKLSGQTCNITLFQELLKEFIAGKYLRGNTTNTTKSSYVTLKLNCIRGSIRYIADKEKGIIVPEIYREKAELKNRVMIDRVNEVEVLSGEKSTIQLFDKDARTIRMSIYDWENSFVKNEVYNLTPEIEGVEWTLEDVTSKLGKYATDVRGQLQRIADEEVKIVIFNPSNESDSFDIIELYKTKENTFKYIKSRKYTFEKNIEGSKFFNGEV